MAAVAGDAVGCQDRVKPVVDDRTPTTGRG
jgi:hypothetical protein